MRNFFSAVCFFLPACLGVSSWAADSGTKQPIPDSATRMEMHRRHLEMKEESPSKAMEWKYLGPTNISGRCTDVEAVSPRGQQYVIWVAAATGGVWKSVNEGTTFEPVFDDMPCASIGDIAIDPLNPDVVWVGTGEPNIFRSSNAGCGVFKTTDGGATWMNMGLAGTHTVPRIRIHPENPDIVYAAAGGHEWTSNPERGLFKTTNGGETWEKILFINDETGVNDLVLHPTEPDILYCTTWQRTRLKWSDPRILPHHEHSGIWKSTNGGQDWQQINTGLPEPGLRGRIGIDIAASNPRVLYAYVDSYEIAEKAKPGQKDAYERPMKDRIKGAKIYRSDNGGETWEQVSGLDERTKKFMENHSGTYGWVFAQIRVDPQDENRIYTMGLALNLSSDGGKTAEVLTGMHGDHHGLWIDPANSDYLLNVQDGGLSISYDRGKNWKIPLKPLPLAQYYNIAFDMAEPFRVFGSIQDHGSYVGTVDISDGRAKIKPIEFDRALGGEGTSHAVDPRDGTVYASTFYGNLERRSSDGSDEKTCLPPPFPGEEAPLGQWITPTILSVHNPDIVYHGMHAVMMSRDRCNTWVDISPDLSHYDPAKRGDIAYQTIAALSESPLRFGLIYAGTDDGRIWRTKDAGGEWTEIGRSPVPAKWVSRLVASEHDLGTVYMTQTGRREDDFQVYVWKSTDLGTTWVDIAGNVPLGPVNVVREDPEDEETLYLGTDAGVYITKDGGETWAVLGDLPFAYVHDLAIHPRDRMIVIATHGRGVWVFDAEQLDEKKKFTDIDSTKATPEDREALVGSWNGELDADGRIMPFGLELVEEGDEITGSMSFVFGQAEVSGVDFDGEHLRFTASLDRGDDVTEIEFEGRLEGGSITGTGSGMRGEFDFTASKEGAESPATD